MIRARRPRSLAALVASAVFIASACTGAATPAPAATDGPGPSSACPTSQPAPLVAGETRTVTIATAMGSISIKVEGALSPIAAGNFVALAECGYYDGVVFHRAATLGDGTPFVIQGGDPSGNGTGGPGYTIKDEPVTATYSRGTVAMARSAAPDSQGSQFFIVLDDGAGGILASYNTYAIFGTVTAGMDTVDKIYADADAEIPSQPVAMDSVTVSNP